MDIDAQQIFRRNGDSIGWKEIMKQYKCELKSNTSQKLRNNMFKELKNEQKGHSKISHICYSTFN